MLSDPLAVTVSGSVRSMARKSMPEASSPRIIGRSVYSLADSSYDVVTRQMLLRNGTRIAEIDLGKTVIDTDQNTVAAGNFRVAVGLRFVVNSERVGISEIAGLRTDLLTFVDSGLQTRLLGGEH